MFSFVLALAPGANGLEHDVQLGLALLLEQAHMFTSSSDGLAAWSTTVESYPLMSNE